MSAPRSMKKVGGRRVAVSKTAVSRKKVIKQRAKEAKAAVDYSIAARDGTRARYNRGDVFESDSVYVMQHKNAETDDVFARSGDKTASRVLTGEELQRIEESENPEAAAIREQALKDRLQQLEGALPETVRSIDNLSDVHRQGERKSHEKFTGSLVNYVFKVQEEVEKAGAREMKARNQQEWINWLEKMYRRHQPFSDDHYKLFRRICEGNLCDDPLWFKQLLLRRMVEKKRITLDECNKLGSEYTTIKTMYPAMRQQVEAHRAERIAHKGVDSEQEDETTAASSHHITVAEALYREDGGDTCQWRWWSQSAEPCQQTLPQTFLQWCSNVQFANEKTDLEAIKAGDIEVFCCACVAEGTNARKRIRFLTAGTDVDDVVNGKVTDETLKHWLDFGKQPVQSVDALDTDAHIFLLDRVDDKVEHWTLECFNVCRQNDDALTQWKALWGQLSQNTTDEAHTEQTKEDDDDRVQDKNEIKNQ